MTRRILLSLVSIFLLFAYDDCLAQFAQRGGVGGNVFDQLGALIPGADITLLDLAQNQSRHVKTDGAGHFEFTNITAGQYQLTAAFLGFRSEKSAPVAVDIGSVTHYDFRLLPGSVSESVTVSAEAGGLETDKTSVDTSVSAKQLEDLPLNGQNFTAIAALAPGISTYPQANVNPFGTWAVGAMFAMGGTAFTTGGSFQGARDNGFYVNGVNINDNYVSSVSYSPSSEALGTGTVRVSDFSAAVGRDIAALTMQTKGGASKFHGEAYEFMENDALNAVISWEKAEQVISNTPGRAVKPMLRRNQFGGNLGGPVYIPKLLPQLKDKAFFFVNYQDFIEHDGKQLITTSVPSAAERNGDFSELLGSNASPVQLYNPFQTTYDANGNSTRPAIPNNRLDLATRPDGSPAIDPTTKAMINALWPLPNLGSASSPNPSNTANYSAYSSPSLHNYHLDTRFDAILSARDSVFVTWSKSNGTKSIGGGIQPNPQDVQSELLYAAGTQDESHLVTVNYAHAFSPKLTNELIFGYGEGALYLITPSEFSWLNSKSNPLNQLFQNTGTGLLTGVFNIGVSGYASPGQNGAYHWQNQALQFSDNVNWVHGRHAFGAGFNYFRKSETDYGFWQNLSVGANFVSSNFSAGGADQGYAGGDGMADFEMALVTNISPRFQFTNASSIAPNAPMIMPSWGFYGNDQFRVTPKLTVTSGLRYELNIPIYTPNPRVNPCCQIFNAAADNNQGIMEIPGIAPGVPQHYLKAPKLEFAPRFSIAYSLRPQTVLRAGYGLFYNGGATQGTIGLDSQTPTNNGIGLNYNINNTSLGLPSDTPHLTLSDAFPTPLKESFGTFPLPLQGNTVGEGYFGDLANGNAWYTPGSPYGGPPAGLLDQKSMLMPYYERMMLDIQQQVRGHNVITISYAGAQGRRGSNEVNINLAPYGHYPGLSSGNFAQYNAARPNNSGRWGDLDFWRPRANSFYNALIVQYKHDLTQGIQITSNYTLGKTVSDYPSALNNLSFNGGGGGVGGSGFQYPNMYNRGEATASHRHRFVFSGIWSPEYGKSWPMWAKESLTGWRISGIETLESGDVLTVSNGGPSTNCDNNDPSTPTHCFDTGTTDGSGNEVYTGSSAEDNAGFDELNVRGNPKLSQGQKAFGRQFDVSKFYVPAMDVRGNSGLGTIRGPGQINLDLSLAKTFPIREGLRLEFRADAYNALNHSQWNRVNTTYPSGDPQQPFGQIYTANGGSREARIGQLAAKLVF